MSSELMTYNILLRDISFSIRSPGPREMSSRDVKTEVDKKTELLDVKKTKNLQSAERAALNMESEYYYQTALPAGAQDYKYLESSMKDYTNRMNKSINDRSLQIYLVEYYKKFSLPFACLAFVLFAFPVGMFTKRSGRSVGFGIGLLVAVSYWGLLFAGQTFGIQNDSSPLLAMWMPNLVIVGAGTVSAVIKFRW